MGTRRTIKRRELRKKKKIMDDYCKELDMKMNEMIAFGNCTTVTSTPYLERPMPQQEKENNMAYDTTVQNLETQQRNHMKTRLDAVKWAHERELETKFHMDSIEPKTLEEALDAFKKGQVKIASWYLKDGKFNTRDYNHINIEMFVFTDPKRDEDGYEAAHKLLGKAYTEAKDKIIVLPLETGLEALSTFEAATF